MQLSLPFPEQGIQIPYCPHHYQVPFHAHTQRFKVVVGGRRSGKSLALLQDLVAHCLNTPQSLTWWVSPTYRDAREIGWEMFMEIKDVLAPAIKKIKETQMQVTFVNGARLLFKGSDNPDSLRGRGLSMVGIDEAAFVKRDVWFKVLRPALADKRGRAHLVSTPNGRNWFYDLYRKARAPSVPYWQGYFWPTEFNPLITEEEIAEARENLSDADFRQEYLAEFITRAGRIYDEFDDSQICTDFHPDRAHHTIYLGMDFGFANPTAICFMAVNNETLEVTQFDEIYKERTTIEQHHQLILKKLAEHSLNQDDIRYCYTDPAGNAEELSSGISPVDYLRQKGYRMVNKGTNVAPGLALVRAYILNAAGKRRFRIDKRCKETTRSLGGYSYKMKGLAHPVPTEEPDKDNIHDHMCDAIRYFFVNRFDHAKYVFSELNQEPYLASPKSSRIMKKCGRCRRPFPSSTSRTQPPFLCKECLDD